MVIAPSDWVQLLLPPVQTAKKKSAAMDIFSCAKRNLMGIEGKLPVMSLNE